MDLSQYTHIKINGIEMKTLEIDGEQIWKCAYVNQVPISKNADGTIYNNIGYKDGYRVRSGGAEAALVSAACTGFIAAKGGDVIRFTGWEVTSDSPGNAINVADASFTNLGQINANFAYGGYGIFDSTCYAYGWQSVVISDGVYQWVVPEGAGISYIRVSGYNYLSSVTGSKMVVTVNEEIV